MKRKDFLCVSFISLDKLVFSFDVVSHKFIDINFSTSVLIALIEKFINDFTSVVLTNSFLLEEMVHFILVDSSITIDIHDAEL